MPRPARRLLALLLLLAFGGGSGGLALLDAGLHHQGRATGHPAGTHIEDPGDPGCHAERCVLGVSQAVLTLGRPAPALVAGALAPQATHPTVTLRPAHRLDAAARPRAPPHRFA